MNMETIKVNPSEFEIGELLSAYGYIMKIERIKAICHTEEQIIEAGKHKGAEVVNRITGRELCRGDDLICYVIKGPFVSGNKSMFEYFRSTISRGEHCGKRESLSSQQGNERAAWYKATIK